MMKGERKAFSQLYIWFVVGSLSLERESNFVGGSKKKKREEDNSGPRRPDTASAGDRDKIVAVEEEEEDTEKTTHSMLAAFCVNAPAHMWKQLSLEKNGLRGGQWGPLGETSAIRGVGI